MIDDANRIFSETEGGLHKSTYVDHNVLNHASSSPAQTTKLVSAPLRDNSSNASSLLAAKNAHLEQRSTQGNNHTEPAHTYVNEGYTDVPGSKNMNSIPSQMAPAPDNRKNDGNVIGTMFENPLAVSPGASTYMRTGSSNITEPILATLFADVTESLQSNL